MIEGWKDRLEEMLKADGRSLRAISLKAGTGPNFLSQMFKDGKDPSFPKLASVLDVLGSTATLYVTSGMKLTPEAEAFIRLALSLDDQGKKVVREALASLGSPSLDAQSPGAPVAEDDTSNRRA
ncbi:helix-turn-helix domain-containing protein [Shinella daejeonensis]|uniref:helix-turn-helix domain-containing protein n=1 Tax=Shinella daejeonensis TaxID=659017 RepID=UPI0020C7B916|nr:helix-turn-helix transcriptional regulator [Shinella daejeonensis]MCP8895316.1 helix-turn-helix domain-containing protein [Shinella daejeonensis]